MRENKQNLKDVQEKIVIATINKEYKVVYRLSRKTKIFILLAK